MRQYALQNIVYEYIINIDKSLTENLDQTVILYLPSALYLFAIFFFFFFCKPQTFQIEAERWPNDYRDATRNKVSGMLWTKKWRDDCIAEKWCRQQRRLSPIKRGSIVRLFLDRPIRRRFFLTKDSSHRQKRNLPQFILQPISLCDCEIDDKSVLAAYRHYIVIILTQICGSNEFYVEI